MSQNSKSQVKTISFVMLITLAGKLLGLYRDRLLAVSYGTGMYANAFNTASQIPRVFFDVLFASAIAASFIPVYTEYREKKGIEAAQKFAGNFITVIGLLTLIMSAVGLLCAGPLVTLFAPEYSAETASLCVSLTRIMIPTLFFTGIAYSFVGILQASDEFNIPALISVISNVIIIVYYIFFDEKFGVFGLSAAFLIGWSMQAVVQIPSLRKKGFRYKPSFSLRNEGMKKVLKLMVPVLVSTWVQPIVLMINSRYASALHEGSGVSVLNYSTTMYLTISGVFVLSVTNVIFPKLSRQSVSEDVEGLTETVKSTVHVSLFFILPMMFGMMALSHPIIDFIYGGGEFGADDVALTSKTMFFMCLGMVGYALQNILCRVYYAKQDGKTPLIASVVSIAVNVVCCEIFVKWMDISGLGLASAVSSTVYAVALAIPLQRAGTRIVTKKFCVDMLKITVSACIMAIAVYGLVQLFSEIFSGILGKLILLIAPTAAGVVVFFALTALLKMEEFNYIKDLFSKILKRG